MSLLSPPGGTTTIIYSACVLTDPDNGFPFFPLSRLLILQNTTLTSGRLISREGLRSTEVRRVCLAFNGKLEMRSVREEGVGKGW